MVMVRPRTPIGELGNVTLTQLEGGQWRARGRLRLANGDLVSIEVTRASKAKALAAVKERAAERVSEKATGRVRTSMTITALADAWFEDMDRTGQVLPQTLDKYETVLDTHVLPRLGSLTVRETTTERLADAIEDIARVHRTQAVRSLTVLRGMLDFAVRYGAIPFNPADAVRRPRVPKKAPVALAGDQIIAVREAIRLYRVGPHHLGPRPDGNLAAGFDLMLGSGTRIGEALALRWCDVDLDDATITIEGTMVDISGQGVTRQAFPKTSTSRRTLRLPPFAVQALRSRLPRAAGPDSPVFATRTGEHMTPHQFRSQLRVVLAANGMTGQLTPHTLRRTVATAIERGRGVDDAASVLGHAGTAVTTAHYIEKRREAVVVGEEIQAIIDAAARQTNPETTADVHARPHTYPTD